MKNPPQLVETTYRVLIGGRATFHLIVGSALLALAGLLTYLWIDVWLLLLIPAWIGGKGASRIIRALEPFAGKPAAPPLKDPPQNRASRVRQARRSRDGRGV